MIKGSLSICDEWCTTSCDAYRITNLADFFCFANPSGFFVFPSQTLQIFCLALRKKAQYVVVFGTLAFLATLKTIIS
jgi:hypothetical protein